MSATGQQTRTFLFADLRGYSAFTEVHGDDAEAALIGRYRALVRQEFGRRHLPAGECGTSPKRVAESDNAVGSGILLFYSAPSSFLWWTHSDAPVLAIASKRGGDVERAESRMRGRTRAARSARIGAAQGILN